MQGTPYKQEDEESLLEDEYQVNNILKALKQKYAGFAMREGTCTWRSC